MTSENHHPSECTFPVFCCLKITVRLLSNRNSNTHNDSYNNSNKNSNAFMSTGSSSSEDAQEIRQRAFDLLNRMGGPTAHDDVNEWPQSPQLAAKQPYTYSSYQQHQQQQFSTCNPSTRSGAIPASIQLPADSSSRSSASSSSSSFTEIFVNCVTDACKMASSEVLRTGYHNLKSVVIPEVEDRLFASRSNTTTTYAPVSGTFHTVEIPTQGYRGRYSDHPEVEQSR